ncbi:MAG: IS30 family transposase, partial [Candidatus Levybacteria bacterium]|nr:IS30 family transposase [Candidatus Levybacteria bacterium]
MYILREKGYSYKEIGKALKRAESSVWNEMYRNQVMGRYDPIKAKHKAYVRRHNAKYQGKKIVENKELRIFVETRLLDGQSPEGISGRLKYKYEKYEKDLPYVSKDSIYRYIKSVYGRKIEAKLRKKKRRGKKRGRLGTIDGRTFIDKRPKHINARMKIGHAEFDFIVSGKTGKGILLVVTDRKLRVSFLEPIYKVSIANVHLVARKIRKRYPEWRTGTTDNDLLFARHKELEKELSIKIYFCHPYHSWEKGTIENTNGEIRKDVPKGSDISKYSRFFFKKLEKKLNDRFMKCLKYKTPNEVTELCRKQKSSEVFGVEGENDGILIEAVGR